MCACGFETRDYKDLQLEFNSYGQKWTLLCGGPEAYEGVPRLRENTPVAYSGSNFSVVRFHGGSCAVLFGLFSCLACLASRTCCHSCGPQQAFVSGTFHDRNLNLALSHGCWSVRF